VNSDQEKEVAQKLMGLGIQPDIKGYHYLLSAIGILLEEGTFEALNKGITKYIYPEIAKKYGTTDSRVERAMRHAHEKAFYTTPMWPELFKVKERVTNSSFLATLTEAIRLKLVS
jgi:two-component system response regulator (stage 0 sporulation protein A)